MAEPLEDLENRRASLQESLDQGHTQSHRNRLGQFGTPFPLAKAIVSFANSLFPAREKVRFLDPAIGTGAFYSAVRKVIGDPRLEEAHGFEVDPHYAVPSISLWKGTQLSIKVADFTLERPSARFNFLVCNPPYVRHHHITGAEKRRLWSETVKASGVKLSGLAGLYCYFLGLAHLWMEEGAVAAWLVPSEFMDVNYGAPIKEYLLTRVTLVRIHRFDPNDVQFEDALVSSAIVWFKNRPPIPGHKVSFTFGGSVSNPRKSLDVTAEVLSGERKWTRFPSSQPRTPDATPTLADFFVIKRGLATGSNKFFILTEDELAKRGLPSEAFKPILPSPRDLPGEEVKSDERGIPMVSRRLFLLDTQLSRDEVSLRFPNLDAYLLEGEALGLDKGYICQHRSPWYAQEDRPPPPIVFTYIGRGDAKSGRPFRFILNHSRATVANSYLALYPSRFLANAALHDPTVMDRVWNALKGISRERLLTEGRVYGGGLHKLEPRELGSVHVPEFSALMPAGYRLTRQTELAPMPAG